jgi:hypothetical protein
MQTTAIEFVEGRTLGDNIRERALVLTVVALIAAAGASALFMIQSSSTGTAKPKPVQAGYLTLGAAEAIAASAQPVSDAASGGYSTPSSYAGSPAADAIAGTAGVAASTFLDNAGTWNGRH